MNDIIFWIVLGVIVSTVIVLGIRLAVKQKGKIIEWLKYATAMAEKELGSKTGQLKLMTVYNWWIKQFPVISIFVSFETFSKWVDIALKTVNEWIYSTSAIANYISTPEDKQIDTSNKEE